MNSKAIKEAYSLPENAFFKDESSVEEIEKVLSENGPDGFIHWKLAKILCGRNFFGPEEWASFYGIILSTEELQSIVVFPWSVKLLLIQEPLDESAGLIRNDFFAFLGLSHFKGEPLTIRKWQKIHPEGDSLSFSYLDYIRDGEPFNNQDTCEFRWYLMLKIPLSCGRFRSFADQEDMISDFYTVPYAVEEVTKDILCMQEEVHTQRFIELIARCHNTNSDGRITVKSIDSYTRIKLSSRDGGGEEPYYSIGASMRPEQSHDVFEGKLGLRQALKGY